LSAGNVTIVTATTNAWVIYEVMSIAEITQNRMVIETKVMVKQLL